MVIAHYMSDHFLDFVITDYTVQMNKLINLKLVLRF